MACFWQGILSSLSIEDKIKLSITNNNIPKFIKALKNLNTKNIDVLWQNQYLSKKQLAENYEHVKNYNESNYNKGYLCGTCDPFLILLCHILEINIKHMYLGNEIKYSKKSKKSYIFGSNKSHFSYKNKISS